MSFKPVSRPVAGLSALAADYDVILSDVWGVVHDGRTHTPSAADALTRFRQKGGTVVLITNAPRPRAPIMKMLDDFGLPRAAYDSIVSSGDVTVDLICARGLAPLHHIGPPRDLSLFDTVAARIGEKPPLLPLAQADYVVCTGLFDDYGDPEPYQPTLVAMKERDLPLICANPDIVVHVGDDLLWCAGALAERYEGLGGRVVMAGKPHAVIYEAALKEAERIRGKSVDRAKILAVGDGLFTDIRGAAAQGFDALFVTSGIHRDVLHPAGDVDDWSVDEAAYRNLLAEVGAAPAAHLRELVW
ncbi:MAG: TIGR01459 family HAD-type hydrolase [Rhodoblastus sp.]|jgi:HAD superfamily hydrolase (TIGR01459 family)